MSSVCVCVEPIRCGDVAAEAVHTEAAEHHGDVRHIPCVWMSECVSE